MTESEHGGTWTWLGIDSYTINPEDKEVEGLTAYRSSGHKYRMVPLDPEDRVDRSVIGDEPETFKSVGMTSIYSDPPHERLQSLPDTVIEIYANADGSRWATLPLQMDVSEADSDG